MAHCEVKVRKEGCSENAVSGHINEKVLVGQFVRHCCTRIWYILIEFKP